MRFIRQSDYKGYITPAIYKQLTGGVMGEDATTETIIAEDTAISLIEEYIGGRYDCDTIFTPWDGTGTDTRNLHIVRIVIVLALWSLYNQTNMADIPEHRQKAYDDAIQWLKDIGRGTIPSKLPPLSEDSGQVNDLWLNSKPPMNHEW